MIILSPALIVLVLAATAALGPLATDMYLPAMPAMAQALGVGAAEIQLTLSVYLAGFACAQLLCGPISDRYGRKPVMIVGLGMFGVASLLCAQAGSIEVLLAGRFLQAFGGATGPVLARAAVRDLYQPREAARVLSYMSAAMALAPAVAPILGGVLLILLGWGSIFLFMTVYAMFLALLLALAFPEPLPAEYRRSIHPAVILHTYGLLLREPRFMGYTLTNAFAFSGLFAFLSGSSFVLIDFLGLSPLYYGICFTVVVAGYASGTLISARLSRSTGIDRLVVVGLTVSVTGGSLMAVLAWSGVYHVLAVILPHAVFMVGLGIIMAQTMAGAIAPFPRFAGSASSVFGFMQMTAAALVGALVGQFHDGTSRTMATAIALAGLVALVSYFVLIRRVARAAGTTVDLDNAQARDT